MARQFTYIVERQSKTGKISYRVGGSNNLRQRLEAHLAGKVRSTKGYTILSISFVNIMKIEPCVRQFYTEAFVLAHYTHQKRAAACRGTVPNWRPAWRRCETCNGSGDYIMNREPIGYWRDDCRDCNGTGGEWLLEENR